MFNACAVIIICIGLSILMWRDNNRNLRKHLDEFQKLHQDSQDLFGKICYMAGYHDALEGKSMDYEKAKKTILEDGNNHHGF